MAKNWPTMLEQYEKGECEGCLCFRGLGKDEKGKPMVICTSTQRPLLDSCVKGKTRFALDYVPAKPGKPKVKKPSKEKNLTLPFVEDER